MNEDLNKNYDDLDQSQSENLELPPLVDKNDETCEILDFFSKINPPKSSQDETKSPIGQYKPTWNPNLVKFLMISRLQGDNTNQLLRTLSLLVDLLESLKTLRKEHNGVVSYSLPDRSFVNKLSRSFPFIVNLRKKEFLLEAKTLTIAMGKVSF